jgi:predicted hydrocarbon binding protein
MIMPVIFLHSIKDDLAKEFGSATATSYLYNMGKRVGADILGLMRRRGDKLPTRVDEIAFNKSTPNRALGIFAGSGTTEVKELDFDKKFVRVRWKDGISVRSHNGKVPVCHFTTGAIAGAVEEWFGVKCEALETHCQGMGDRYCEAIIGRPKQVEKMAEEGNR